MSHYGRVCTRHIAAGSLALIFILGIILATFTVRTAPIRMLGGAIWLDGGAHYISDAQISTISTQINAPIVAKMFATINTSTAACDTIESGFCKESDGTYADKELLTPAVVYQAGTPDVQQVVGYCTLCADDTFSPSCAVGRGACSYHGGVAEYNVAEYRTIPGKPEVAAKPAVYSYTYKTELDSTLYAKPGDPSLSTIVASKYYKSMLAER